ncbi:stage II sporulation protein P [Paenibacillus caui]|uniref:stage II sporulation protein P n=1 Tax=Paenibacillus caui TaxID=2873927 RepID=UPI001CA8B611|nr:stage II sporulation protein P [Paenibacillus caui]
MNGFKTWNIGLLKRKIIQILATGKTLIVLALMSMLFFIMLGVGGLAEKSLNTSPVSSMKGLASTLSSGFFAEMLGMEVPHLKPEKSESSDVFSGKHMTNFVFQLLTNINPSDPKSLVSREVPGLGNNSPILLRASSRGGTPTAPEDYRTDNRIWDGSGKTPDTDKDKVDDPSQGNGSSGKPGNSKDSGDKDGDSSATQPSKNKVKAVMVYHSHPHESYNPLLGTKTDNPSSANRSKNVGVVGDFIAEELEKKGVGAHHVFEDYMKEVSGYNYNYSYKYSRATLKDALADYQTLNYFIDIHRDSQSYKKTTTTIEGVSYAQIYFIIGHGNPDWRKNEAFASKIHERMEKAYPGLSRGIWGKTSAQGNGEYNQSLSPNSLLIEVGGIDNSEEELQRSSKILADIIADVYFEDQKAKKASTVQAGKNTVKNTDKGKKQTTDLNHS